MKKVFWWLVPVFMSVTVVSTTLAQACTFDVNTVLNQISASCGDIGQNEICYGNAFVSAVPASNVQSLQFTNVGDRVELNNVQQLLLLPFDQVTDIWGAALVMVQAQLEGTLPGQLVPIVMFGNVDFRNEGINTNGVQAFRFQTGIGQANCQGLPPDGIMIRTPQGLGQLTFNLNGVDVTLGSTGFFQADVNGNMTISMIEGTATALGFTASQGQALEINTATNQIQVVPYDPLLIVNVLPVYVWSNDIANPTTVVNVPPTPIPQPCTVSTNRRDFAALRVGPGTNRTNRSWLEPGRVVTVTGESADELWWQLDKVEATNQAVANSVLELWVAKEQVTASGDCDAIGVAAPPPVIAPQPTAAPVTPTATLPPNIIASPTPPLTSVIAAIGSFTAADYTLTMDPKDDEACTTVFWTGVDGGPGASIFLVVDGDVNGVTGPNGSQTVCLDDSATIELQLIAPNASNGNQFRSIFIDVNVMGLTF